MIGFYKPVIDDAHYLAPLKIGNNTCTHITGDSFNDRISIYYNHMYISTNHKVQ